MKIFIALFFLAYFVNMRYTDTKYDEFNSNEASLFNIVRSQLEEYVENSVKKVEKAKEKEF